MPNVAPVAKTVFVCDDIVRDVGQNKTSILNMFDTVHGDEDDGSQMIRLGKLCVYSELSDGFGDLKLWVEAVRLDSFAPIFRTESRVFRFASRLTNVQVLFRLTELRFPEAGDYLIRLYCEDEMVGDRVLHVLP